MPSNVGLVGKILPRANALVYFAGPSVTKEKKVYDTDARTERKHSFFAAVSELEIGGAMTFGQSAIALTII